jgi:apolipoprotein N-acyltransferase
MQDAINLGVPLRARVWKSLGRVRAFAPARVEAALAVLSSVLLILSFPDFDLWPLAWVGLVPLLLAVARKPQPRIAFVLGWMTGTLFFYGSCYWLAYSMIRYGRLPAVVSYLLLVPGALTLGLFPAISMAVLARALTRWGARALFVAPVLWSALEWARLGVTGQLWNSIGYSQAYHPALIQAARWGGVYLIGFLILLLNSTIVYIVVERKRRSIIFAAIPFFLVFATTALAFYQSHERMPNNLADERAALVVAVQPNVPMEQVGSLEEAEALRDRHVNLSEEALQRVEAAAQSDSHNGSLTGRNSRLARVVIWPESPMYFSYANDSAFREWLARFAAKNRTAVLFNSLEPAPLGGDYNSAVMVNEEGRLVAQYDKIRLLPFGEYVPLPRWIPGVSMIPTMVGDFTPGAQYALLPFGQARAGVFICFESAFPAIAREFANEGADVLVNISNDGYLGPTPVMRQHLANAVFRAVENNRPVLRVTNTGITAYINAHGEVSDETGGFETAVRTWTVTSAVSSTTFYTRRGDLFVGSCAAISILILGLTSLRFGSGSVKANRTSI